MALSNDEIAAVMRLKDEMERGLGSSPSLLTAARDAAAHFRDIVAPPALRPMREMHEQLATIAFPPYLQDLRDQAERLQLLFGREQVKALADAFAGVTRADQIAAGASAQLIEQFRLLSPPDDYFAGLKSLMAPEGLSAAISKSLVARNYAGEALERVSNLLGSFELPTYARELQQLSAMAFESEKMLGTIDVDHGFGNLLGVHDVTRALVEYETSRLNRAFAGFGASIAARPAWLETAPDFVVTAPTDVVFAQARFVRSVTTHVEIEDSAGVDEIWASVQQRTLRYIEAVLPELSPKLMKSWQGVWEAARRRGPDWARHAGSSLRFILVEVLDTVAPISGLSEIPREYIQNGKLGRPAQVYWLCRPITNRTYRRVARADLESAISIIDAMSEAIHRHDYIEIEAAFDTMAIRAAIALCNLLKLWKART